MDGFNGIVDDHEGRRTSDDERQIKRWLALAGPNGRFLGDRLMNRNYKKTENI